MRKAIESGMEPVRKHVLSVETALLVVLMSPKLPEEDSSAERGFLTKASGVFRKLTTPLPTRQHARRVYKEFEEAFAKKPASERSSRA